MSRSGRHRRGTESVKTSGVASWPTLNNRRKFEVLVRVAGVTGVDSVIEWLPNYQLPSPRRAGPRISVVSLPVPIVVSFLERDRSRTVFLAPDWQRRFRSKYSF